MSGTGPKGSKGTGHEPHLLSSSPAHVARPKSSSSSLSSQLSAHLSKPTASSRPSTASAAAIVPPHSTPSSSTDRKAPAGVNHSGKAVASAADAENLADSELWKSNAAKRAEKAWAVQSEKGLQSDVKFKRYIASVDKSLATFENVSEWADFIAFLSRLLKTFQLSTNFNAIPRKLIVAKRLSQCLNPALPSGVHQRALDVYEHILTVIGSEGLRRDLSIWTPGLLPFFQFASTSVKPIILSIFERHYLALGKDLRPATRSFLLATLPGLEEDTNEFFDRVIRLLDRVKESVGHPFFLQNLFMILISSPTSRLASLNYLSRRLHRLNGTEIDGTSSDVESLVGLDLGILVRGFASALEDETILLVRRAALDILVTHLRLDSLTWKEHVRHEDKVRLIKAALAVVLRRDLSLNRRLYAWILGPSEDIPTQQKYFEDYAQQLSRLALQSELIKTPLSQVEPQLRELEGNERQRPFKIFVSLLDKWSIGQPLTSALILDVFRSLQVQLSGIEDVSVVGQNSLKATATDITTTAKMLFEVVDPFATYRQFYYAIKKELIGDEGEMSEAKETPFSAILLLRFVLKSFRVHDEESRQIHLPILLSIVIELLHRCKDVKVTNDAITLARDLLGLIPKRVFSRIDGQGLIGGTFVEHATSFYEADSYNTDEAAQRYIGFQHPQTQKNLLTMCAEISQDEQVRVSSLQLLSQLLRVLDSTVDLTTEGKQDKVPWKADEWATQSCLPALQAAQHFDEIEAFSTAMVEGARCRALDSSIELGHQRLVSVVLGKLFFFLREQWSSFHVRTVELLWEVEDLAKGRYIETLLCKGLTGLASDDRQMSREILGTIWQYSTEERLAGPSVTQPLFRILDGLRSTSWMERQASEKWLRSNIRGYTLLLDPLLHIIATSGIRRLPHQIKFKDRSFDFYEYSNAFDHEMVLFASTMMLHLAKVGGQGFVKAIRSTMVKRSQFKSVVVAFGGQEADATYLQALLKNLLLFVRSDAASSTPYAESFTMMHTTSTELLQTLTSRGNLQGNWLNEIEGALLERIYVSIQRTELDVQISLLQALHSVIRAKTSSESGSIRDHPPPNQLLFIDIKEGITRKSNRSVLSYWSDFILNIVPYYRKALTSLLLPLNETVCRLLVQSMTELRSTFLTTAPNVHSEITEADLISLMNISERLLLQCLDSADTLVEGSQTPITATSTEKSESAGLISVFSNVFQGDVVSTPVSSVAPSTMSLSSNSILRSVHHTIQSLHAIWVASSENEVSMASGQARQQSLEVINPRIKSRCRRSLEKIYRNNSGEVVESLIDSWNLAGGSKKVQLQGANDALYNTALTGMDTRGMEGTFDILSTLAPSAQIVVTFLCDVISTRTTISGSMGSDRVQSKKSFTPIVSDYVLLSFWEAYLDRLDHVASVQVWPVVIMLVKDIIHNNTIHKAQMYPVLRSFTVTGEKIFGASSSSGTATAGGHEDKRMKRELVDNYLKLCDFNILIAGKSFEQTNWIGRRALALDDGDAEEDGGSSNHTGAAVEEKLSASLQDLSSSSSSALLIESINEYLGSRALPALRKFGVDQDKVLTICTNIVYYIISPALRQKRKTIDLPTAILKLLDEVTRMPGTVKAWKNTVADVFQDQRFFHMRLEAGLQWRTIVCALINSDKERFVDLVSKVTSIPSSNIFTNREAETLSRSTNLRRITYLIYASEKDHWLTQLPLLQEKLVDLLRNGSSDPVGSEVYLCLRVLLFRFSTRQISGLWPVIITELMRLLEACLEEPPSDNSDALQLVFSASKFLDLLLTLQTDDFQIHQWLFITDTVDVVYPAKDWISDSILDRMAVALTEKQQHGNITAKPSTSRASAANQQLKAVGGGGGAAASIENTTTHLTIKRKPRLIQMGSVIPKIESLQPFFANISLSTFQETYDCGEAIDWRAVEQSIESDLFPSEESV
ncbi:hypothetical protein CBS101457_002169 [Exobasidium rhododendri]|nr:hypothetical protein CBS101457_002169 [Exobasidium rhododendri]